jgi:hypothetical protein
LMIECSQFYACLECGYLLFCRRVITTGLAR